MTSHLLNQVTQGDCLELMAKLPDASVDMVLCDLPYGTTDNKWDSLVCLDRLWEQYKRVIKPNGTCVLTGQMPFSAHLVTSNLGWFRYAWVWEKTKPVGFLRANKAPLRAHEDVLVFSPVQPRYSPQMAAGAPYRVTHPTSLYGSNYKTSSTRAGTVNINNGTRYPRSVVKFSADNKRSLHPTQKPVALFEYLIRTYTNEGDVVLDNCCGSGTTGVAAINTGRQFIQFELSPEYCEIARKRLAQQRLAA